MNRTFLQNQSISKENLWLSFYVIPVLISLHVFVIVKLYIKHKHHIEPIHIYEFSILSDMTVWFTTFFLGNFEWNYQGWAPYCVLVNFVDTSARLSGYADISASQVDRFYIRYIILYPVYQVDRFLALYWNSEYKERVTVRQACAPSRQTLDCSLIYILKIIKYETFPISNLIVNYSKKTIFLWLF